MLKFGLHFAADACRCIKKGKVSQKAWGGERGKTKDKEEQRTCVVFSLGTSLTRLMSTLILVHNCTIFLCSLDVRNPNMNINKDHRVG